MQLPRFSAIFRLISASKTAQRRIRREAANPEEHYGVFYAQDAQRRLNSWFSNNPRTVGLKVRRDYQARRARAFVAHLRDTGLQPDHLVVDYGCGSLFIGRNLITFLDVNC